MAPVSAPTSPSFWQRTKGGSKAGFDKLWSMADKLGEPVNNFSNKIGSEAFWPTTLDKESDKAARILRSFCKDGFYNEELASTQNGPKQKQRVLKKIPAEVIRNAKGLAIFTTMRSGLWVSGAGGSGVLVGRKEDGTWSAPSGILLHTAGLGFLVGIDIYDCVIVMNTQEALDAFKTIRCTLGGELSAVAGPVGAGGILETEVHKRQSPIFTYLKSRGFYAGVQVDGTIVIERSDENERFYHSRLSAAEILSGKIRHPPYEVNTLLETIKAAEGRTDIDESLVPQDTAPSSFQIEDTGAPIFSVPDKDDPDPYGVRALQREGLEIKEAGTQARGTDEDFEFRPSPTSPIFNAFNRHSIESRSLGSGPSRRSSWRTSTLSIDRATMTDSSTQTPTTTSAAGFDNSDPNCPASPPPAQHSSPRALSPRKSPDLRGIPEHGPTSPPPNLPPRNSPAGQPTTADDRNVSSSSSSAPTDTSLHDPAVLQHIHQPPLVTKARLVTVRKRSPPKLPPRNPARPAASASNSAPGSAAASVAASTLAPDSASGSGSVSGQRPASVASRASSSGASGLYASAASASGEDGESKHDSAHDEGRERGEAEEEGGGGGGVEKEAKGMEKKKEENEERERTPVGREVVVD